MIRLGESRLRLGPGILDPTSKFVIKNCRGEVLIISMTVNHLTKPIIEGRELGRNVLGAGQETLQSLELGTHEMHVLGLQPRPLFDGFEGF